jgi:hypothetical protein
VQINAAIVWILCFVDTNGKTFLATGRPDPASWLPSFGIGYAIHVWGRSKRDSFYFWRQVRTVVKENLRSIPLPHLTLAADAVSVGSASCLPTRILVDYFVIDTDWDETLNSPWDALWYEGDSEALDCLAGSLPLEAIWKAPRVKIERRHKRPDVYSFELNRAVTKRVRDMVAPIVREEAEFLPLAIPRIDPIFVIHPLWPIDLDDGAEVQCNEVSRNIAVVRRFSFTLDPDQYDGPRHLFRMRQAKGSAARDHGFTLSTLIVSEVIKAVCEEHGVTGIVFKKVQSATKPEGTSANKLSKPPPLNKNEHPGNG